MVLVSLGTAALLRGGISARAARRRVGELAWVFNLASLKAGRRYLRVHHSSIPTTASPRITPAAVYASLVPGPGATIPASHLRRVWGVSQELMAHLIAQGCLQATPAGRGSQGSPRIRRASALRFLKSRRLPRRAKKPQDVCTPTRGRHRPSRRVSAQLQQAAAPSGMPGDPATPA
jgi:hypothetical protein